MRHVQMVRLVGPAFACTYESHKELKRDEAAWNSETKDSRIEEFAGELFEVAECKHCGSTLLRPVKGGDDTEALQRNYHEDRLRAVAWAVDRILGG